MKSPKKYSWRAVIVFTPLGAFGSGYLSFLFSRTPDPNITKIVVIPLLIFLLYLFAGWAVRKVSYTIFNRRVDHPVDPKDLTIGQTYWLNGETWATYKDQDDLSGKHLFSIYGLNNAKKPNDTTGLYPEQVRVYIASVREVVDQNDKNYPH